MNAQPFAAARRSPSKALYLLIALMPFADFLQTSVVGFSAAPVMGGIAAGPQEYAGVATLYAFVAISVIALHRYLVERLGWRLLVQLSCVSAAVGVLVCAQAGALWSFGTGRALMALGSASFFTAARSLINHIPPSPQRFLGIRFFAAGVAWSAALGPALAALALTWHSWRLAFLVLLLPLAAIALLAGRLLPDARERPELRGSAPHPAGLLLLTAASFALLHALQRSGYDFFSHPAPLWWAAALGLAALALFIVLERRRTRPWLRLAELGQRRYVIGLAVFALCYLVLGGNGLMLGVLLQRGLGVPLESLGLYLGLGSLAGVVALVVLMRLLPQGHHPVRYYLVAFSLLLASCLWLSGISESVHPLARVLPGLLLYGAFILVALPTTAMQTFQTLQRDEQVFSHANQLKNMVSQYATAAGMALATLCLQWRGGQRRARLVESLTPANTALQPTLDDLSRQFQAVGQDAGTASRMALAQLNQMLEQEATLLAVLDYFRLLGLLAVACLILILLVRATGLLQPRNSPPMPVASHPTPSRT